MHDRCIYVYLNAGVHVCVCVCVRADKHVEIWVCMWPSTYACMPAYKKVCLYVRINTNESRHITNWKERGKRGVPKTSSHTSKTHPPETPARSLTHTHSHSHIHSHKHTHTHTPCEVIKANFDFITLIVLATLETHVAVPLTQRGVAPFVVCRPLVEQPSDDARFARNLMCRVFHV